MKNKLNGPFREPCVPNVILFGNWVFIDIIKDGDLETDGYTGREEGLTGTKYACGRGSCGACTVMVSKHDPVSKKIRHFSITACLVPICSLYGAAVTTVEGIGSIKTRLHPVQERIAKGHGTQCGFCTPGMVMSMYALLRNHLHPSEEQLMEAWEVGNLCRCTGYRSILESGKTFCMVSRWLYRARMTGTQELVFQDHLKSL
uniref:Uncharacterized protein n=1 Tax=Spermophilus dauricus TaxID=99837 RepID=A0A8C9P8E9_SPEDA